MRKMRVGICLTLVAVLLMLLPVGAGAKKNGQGNSGGQSSANGNGQGPLTNQSVNGTYSFRLVAATSFSATAPGDPGGVSSAPRQDILRVGVFTTRWRRQPDGSHACDDRHECWGNHAYRFHVGRHLQREPGGHRRPENQRPAVVREDLHGHDCWEPIAHIVRHDLERVFDNGRTLAAPPSDTGCLCHPSGIWQEILEENITVRRLRRHFACVRHLHLHPYLLRL